MSYLVANLEDRFSRDEAQYNDSVHLILQSIYSMACSLEHKNEPGDVIFKTPGPELLDFMLGLELYAGLWLETIVLVWEQGFCKFLEEGFMVLFLEPKLYLSQPMRLWCLSHRRKRRLR